MTSNWRLASAPIAEGGTAINDTAINGTPTIRAQIRRFIARPQLIASYYTHDTHEAGAQNQLLPVISFLFGTRIQVLGHGLSRQSTRARFVLLMQMLGKGSFAPAAAVFSPMAGQESTGFRNSSALGLGKT
jgi:hypothetical protein